VSDVWWRHPFRMFQTNLRLIDAGLDAEAVADAVRAHGADAWLVNTGGIYASHPSALASQTPNPFLAERQSGDLVADALAAAKSRGLRYMARMDFSKVLPEHADRHPEWLFVSADGERQVFNDLVTTCPSGGYFQQEAFAILDEIVDRYPVDGFFFNWFTYSEFNYAYRYFGPCHCDACREGFRAATGGELPRARDDAAYPAWQAWSEGMLLDLGRRITDHIHARLPEAGLILSDAADLRYEEANNGVGREPWRHHTAEGVSAALTHLPDVPVLVNCVSFLDFPYRMGSEEPERFAQYLIQSLSRGASISTYIMGYPGRIEYPSLALAGEITRYHRDAQAWYEGLRQDSPVLLVSRGAFWGLTEMPDQVREFRGIHSALQELHVPFDVVEARHLGELGGRLSSYSLVVLPDLGELGPDAAAQLDDYVSEGGRVLATASSGIDAEGAVQLASLGTVRRVEVRSGSDLLSSYVQLQPPHVVPLHGTYHVLERRADATARMNVMPPARYGPPEYCYGHEVSDDPGVVFGRHHAGRTAHVPWTIGQAYFTIGTRNLRDAFAEVVADLVPEGFGVETDLPQAVEVTLGRGARGRLVHLISHVHATARSYADPITLRGHRLRIAAPGIRHARSLVTGRLLETTRDGDDLIIALPDLGRFDAIAMEEQ